MGAVGLNFDHAVTSKLDKGNFIGLVSGYTKDDGSQHEMADAGSATRRQLRRP